MIEDMDHKEIIENDLKKILADKPDDLTCQAARYSLLSGGKRIRPKMMCMTYEMFGGSGSIFDDVRYYAATLEMIHTYSLIHDDLPCMDNDDLRRGNPTCHKKFGEGIATLAGDLLLNTAMERLMAIALDKPSYLFASYRMAYLAGIEGMIGGQSIDITSENKKIPPENLYELQEKKTGALIECAILTPYYLINKTDRTSFETDDNITLLRQFASHVGLAFQIRDDILDFTSDPEVLGKSCGKDERDNKSTFVTLLGIDKANERLSEETDRAHMILKQFEDMGYNTKEYSDLVDYLKIRGN